MFPGRSTTDWVFMFTRDRFGAYLRDAQEQLLICRDDCKEWCKPEPTPAAPFQEGLFLSTLYDKLYRFLEHSFDENMMLTGLLNALTVYPQQLLHQHLFRTIPKDETERRRSLLSILQAVTYFPLAEKSHSFSFPRQWMKGRQQ